MGNAIMEFLRGLIVSFKPKKTMSREDRIDFLYEELGIARSNERHWSNEGHRLQDMIDILEDGEDISG